MTNFIATDLVSAPLLWVIPLALYLASFIVAFSPRGGWAVRLSVLAAPAMVTLLWVPYGSAGGWPLLAVLSMELGAFAHRRDRAPWASGAGPARTPPPDRVLPLLATGGALASAFVAILAPLALPGRLGVPDPAGRRARRARPRRARARPPRHRPRTGRRGLDFEAVLDRRSAAGCDAVPRGRAGLMRRSSSRPARSRPRPGIRGSSSAA